MCKYLLCKTICFFHYFPSNVLDDFAVRVIHRHLAGFSYPLINVIIHVDEAQTICRLRSIVSSRHTHWSLIYDHWDMRAHCEMAVHFPWYYSASLIELATCLFFLLTLLITDQWWMWPDRLRPDTTTTMLALLLFILLFNRFVNVCT